MKTTMLHRGPASGLLLLALIAAGIGAPTPIRAQDAEPAECRCVDAAGNEIEECTCLRMPQLDEMVPRLEAMMPRIREMMPRFHGEAPGVAVFGDRRVRLGISVRAAEPSATDAEGVEVEDVLDGGPAADAGLEPGDVITHLDGHDLTEPLTGELEERLDLDTSIPAQRLLALARELERGQQVEIRYLRDGRPQTTIVEAGDVAPGLRGLAPRPRDGARAWTFRGDPDFEVRVRPDGAAPDRIRILEGPGSRFFFGGTGRGAGLELVEMNPALGAYFDVDSGVLVADVGASSTLGLEPGDVVLTVDGRAVDSPERLRAILASYGEDEEIRLVIVREGEERTVTAPVRD